MKRTLGFLLLAVTLAWAGNAVSHEESEAKAGHAKAATVTVTGEIVDTGCYLGHAQAGPKHKQCALTCIAKGMPMGLLTAKGELYLLTPPHTNPDAYNKAKDWAGTKVVVTGEMNERAGMKSIEVARVKQAPPATSGS